MLDQWDSSVYLSEGNLHWTQGITSLSTIVIVTTLLILKAFTLHALVSMLVNCLVYGESLVLPVAVDKRKSKTFNMQ